MFYAYKLIGSLLVPPGLLCVITAIFSFVLFRSKNKKLLSIAMLMLSLSIWFMSTSAGSFFITGGLERKHLNSVPETERPVAFLVLAVLTTTEMGMQLHPVSTPLKGSILLSRRRIAVKMYLSFQVETSMGTIRGQRQK